MNSQGLCTKHVLLRFIDSFAIVVVMAKTFCILRKDIFRFVLRASFLFTKEGNVVFDSLDTFHACLHQVKFGESGVFGKNGVFVNKPFFHVLIQNLVKSVG